jgi:SagB-type dehydrogenase family enzyme
VSFPPHEFIDVKAHQAHYKASNLALQREEKRWPVAPRTSLPSVPLDRLPAGPVTDGSLDRDTLALLLRLTAGWRGVEADRVNRWTASGGNIGSVVAHVAVRDVAGLEPGVYGYVGSAHELALLRCDPGRVPGTGAATIVYSGHFSRVATKYGPFGLRVVLLDAGCAFATLRACCAALGIDCRPQPRWDDDLVAAAIGIDPDVEPLTNLTDLGRLV